MERIANQLVIRGADGTMIACDPATFGATRDIVSKYYVDFFEVARQVAGQHTVSVGRLRVDASNLIDLVEPTVVALHSAVQHLRGGETYLLATVIGPLLGHFTALQNFTIPTLSAAETPLRAKQQGLRTLMIKLHDMGPMVARLELAAHTWKSVNPGPVYRNALRAATNAYDDVLRTLLGDDEVGAPEAPAPGQDELLFNGVGV